jgi:hypothetical protein
MSRLGKQLCSRISVGVLRYPHATRGSIPTLWNRMKSARSPIEVAAGQLILAIQKEWNARLGAPDSAAGEQVMSAAHDLLKAAKTGTLADVVGSSSISRFLGTDWIQAHPLIVTYVSALENAASMRP